MISSSLDIGFIYGDIHGRSYKSAVPSNMVPILQRSICDD